MARTYLTLLAVISLSLGGCTVVSGPTPLTPLEIQSIQTRDYEAPKETVFASVISVFQDLGYTINSADIATGLITAESVAGRPSEGYWAAAALLGELSVSQTKATAFVEPIGKQTRVRINFTAVRKTSSIYGQTDRQDTRILHSPFYQNVFEKIDSALFIRSSH